MTWNGKKHCRNTIVISPLPALLKETISLSLVCPSVCQSFRFQFSGLFSALDDDVWLRYMWLPLDSYRSSSRFDYCRLKPAGRRLCNCRLKHPAGRGLCNCLQYAQNAVSLQGQENWNGFLYAACTNCSFTPCRVSFNSNMKFMS
jgi:hypothetical protein